MYHPLSRLRRHLTLDLLVAASLIAGWTTVWIGAVVHPASWPTPQSAVADAAANPGSVFAYAVLSALYGVLFVPAVLGTVRLIRGRGAALTFVAAGLFTVGLLGHCFEVAGALTLLALVRTAGATDPAQAMRLWAAVQAAMGPLFALIVGFMTGMPLLLVALWRGGRTSGWPILALLAAYPMGIVGSDHPFSLLWTLGTVLAEASVVWAAVDLARGPRPAAAAPSIQPVLQLQPQP